VDGNHAVQFQVNSFSEYGLGTGTGPTPVVSTPASSPWSLMLGGLFAMAAIGVGMRFRTRGSVA